MPAPALLLAVAALVIVLLMFTLSLAIAGAQEKLPATGFRNGVRGNILAFPQLGY